MKSFAILALCVGSSLAAPQTYYSSNRGTYTYRFSRNINQPKTFTKYPAAPEPYDNPYKIKSQFPAAKTIGSADDGSSANARAALEYVKAAGANDVCGRATKAYLEIIVGGGSADDANAAAQDTYRSDYSSGLRVESGSACEAAQVAFKKASAEGKDAVQAATVAYMENSPGAREGNPCAVAGRDYVNSILGGDSHSQAHLSAAKSFDSAIKRLAAAGKELRDPVCAASTKAYYDALPNKPAPALGAAMVAFLDKAFDGFSYEYDPVCWRTTEAFLDSYTSGKNELSSAAEVFLSEYARGGQALPADSPCTAAAIAYSKSTENPISPAVKSAMEAFIAQMVKSGRREPDAACAEATKSYLSAYRSGATDEALTLAAAKGFFDAFDNGLEIAVDSPCTAASQAYFKNLPTKPSGPSAAAMLAFINEAVSSNLRKPDPVCLSSARAYIEAILDGKSEAAASEIAGIAFLDAVSGKPNFDRNSPCGVAAKAYMANLDL